MSAAIHHKRTAAMIYWKDKFFLFIIHTRFATFLTRKLPT